MYAWEIEKLIDDSWEMKLRGKKIPMVQAMMLGAMKSQYRQLRKDVLKRLVKNNPGKEEKIQFAEKVLDITEKRQKELNLWK